MEKVLISGAGGFIASHIVEQLLGKGYRVVGSVREPDNDEKYGHLKRLSGADERLQLIKADLLEDGAFDEAASECSAVLHTASPYIINVNNPKEDLLDPALKGTENIIKSCLKSTTVKRLVLTSSLAAITDEPVNGKVYTEGDWNTKSSLSRNPYYYSKVSAERRAWQMVEDSGSSAGFDMTVINPFMVIGPSHDKRLNQSNKILKDILYGEYPFIMELNWGFVDVRDTAKAHILAMEAPQAKGRNLCVNESMTMEELVSFMKESGYNKGYKLPSMKLGGPANAMIKLFSMTKGSGVSSYINTHLGKRIEFSNRRIKENLGMDFLPLKQTLSDTLKDMKDKGHL